MKGEERDSGHAKGDNKVRRWVVIMNVFDSTMGRIHVCLLCCLLVTIRGLVGLSIGSEGWFLFTGATQQQVERSNLDVCVLPTLNCKRVVMVQPGG